MIGSATAWPSRLHVLLVEDDPRDAELTCARLTLLDTDCDIHRVDTEADFRAALRGPRFDVILCDFMLPAFSGVEALQIARAEAADIPFIFVSGVLGEEHAVDMVRQGAVDYVLKQRLQRLPMTVRRAVIEARERQSRINAETALREYETGFRLLVDALRDYAVIGLDRNGNVRSWNGAAERLFGFRADQITGDFIGRLYHADPEAAGEVPVSLAGATRDGSHVRDRWLHNGTGELFFASLVTTAIRNDDGELIGFSKIIRDVTEQRRAADALREAKEEAEAANAAKDRFLAMLSHELRTPLTPILAATSFLEQHAAGLPAALGELLPMVRRNIEREARLIDDLLDLNTVTHDKLSLTMQPMDLHDALAEVLGDARVDAEQKSVELQTRLEAADTRIRGDAGRVQQIVGNLIRNAVKFTSTGGRVLVETANPDANTVMVRVTDNGIGISEAALPRIFTAFEQGDGAITRQYGGLGLGLAIASALAIKHGGKLHAHSEGENRGAQFTLTLPLTPDAIAPPAPITEDAGDGRPLHILLVEDNPDTIMAMTTLLKLCGHSVDAAESVEESVALSGSRRFDLLISDLGLPDGDGIDVVRGFIAHQDAPSIAVTGYGMEDDIRRCREAGFTAHVTKPVGFDRLNELIQSLTLARR